MYSIYKLQSTATDKVYIGCTSKTLNTRFSLHKSHFKIGTKSVFYDYLRDNNISIHDFDIVRIDEADEKRAALKLEQHYIKSLSNTLNYAGKLFSDEHRKNCSIAQKKLNKKISKKHKKLLSKLHTGNTYRKGSTHSQEAKDKMSESSKGQVAWNKGKTGTQEVNSGSFGEGHQPWNKGKKGLQKGSCLGRITVHKDNKNYKIQPEKLDEYLANGFIKGMKPRTNAKGYYLKGGKYVVICKGKNYGTYVTEEEAQEVRRKAML